MARLRVVLVAALVSGASASRTGALFGKLSGLVGKTKGQIAHVLDGLVVDREYRRELPPYDAVELGVDGGCWPIFTTLASGDAYALRVTGLASQKDAAAFVSRISADGVLSLGIAAPGVHSVDGLQVTLELPPDALRRLILGPHSAGAELLARPSEELEVASAGATGSQLILSPQLVGGDDGACAGQQPGSDCHHKDKEGTLRVVVTQGTEPVTVCAPNPTAVAIIEVTNNAQSNIIIANYTAARATIRSTGHGAVYVFPGEAGPLGSTKLIHNGAGELQITSSNTEVTQTGSGEAYLIQNSQLTGHITGSGNVYYDGGNALDVRVTGSGDAILRTGPPPPPVLQCPPPPGPNGDNGAPSVVRRPTVGTIRVAYAGLAGLSQCQVVPNKPLL